MEDANLPNTYKTYLLRESASSIICFSCKNLRFLIIMYATAITKTTTTMMTTTSAPTAVATPVTRPSELESKLGVGIGMMAELLHLGSDTNSPESSNTVHAEKYVNNDYVCM